MKTRLLLLFLFALVCKGDQLVNGTLESGSIGVPPGASPLTFLTHYWRMEESAGNDRVDAIGAKPFQQVSGTFNQVGGKHGFGNNAAAEAYFQTASLSLTMPYSISAWVYIGAGDTGQTFPILFENATSTHFFGHIAGCPPSIETFNLLSADYTGLYDSWHFVVVTVSASRIGLSLDGGAFTYAGTGSSFTGNLIIGNYPAGDVASPSFDEVGTYNVELTQSQVSLLWNGGSGLFY